MITVARRCQLILVTGGPVRCSGILAVFPHEGAAIYGFRAGLLWVATVPNDIDVLVVGLLASGSHMRLPMMLEQKLAAR